MILFFRNLPLGWLFLSLLLSGCGHKEKEIPPQAKAVEAILLKPQRIEQHERLLGTVRAAHETRFCAKASGILRIQVTEGKPVKAGALLGYIENNALVKRAEILAEVEKYKQLDYKRYEELYAAQHISVSEYEKAKQAWLKAQQDTCDAQNALKDTQFRAPYDGICGLFHAPDGAFVKSDDTVVSFYDTSIAYVDLAVPEPLLLRPLQHEVRIDEKIDGELLHVEPVIDPATHMGLARVKIPSLAFPLGSTVFADVTVERHDNVLGIPQEALLWREGRSCVYRIENGKALLRPVKIGIQGHQILEITEGLNPGDTLVRRVQDSLYDGCSIEIVPAP